MYEIFEHTADVGLRVQSQDLPGLFEDAVRGFAALLVVEVDSIQPREEITLEVVGADASLLLFDLLNELLYRVETDHWLPASVSVTMTSAGLTAHVRGEPFDAGRHAWGQEVKAVTYHGLQLNQTATGCEAEVIFDI